MQKQDFFVTLPLKISLWRWLNSFRILRWQAEWVERQGSMLLSHSQQKLLASIWINISWALLAVKKIENSQGSWNLFIDLIRDSLSDLNVATWLMVRKKDNFDKSSFTWLCCSGKANSNSEWIYYDSPLQALGFRDRCCWFAQLLMPAASSTCCKRITNWITICRQVSLLFRTKALVPV